MKELGRLFALAIACCSSPVLANDFSQYGLTIMEHDLSSKIVPELERPDRPVKMWDIQPQEQRECENLVEIALGVYPPIFIRALVRRLVLAGDIYVWNKPVGGMQVPGVIAINCIQPFNNTDLIPDGVHDAIAGLVSNVAPPNWTAWETGNKSGFRYGDMEAYKAELSDPDARNVSRRLNADGFVSQYGLTGKLADFESYAEQVFGHGSSFAALVRQYSPMKHKLAVMLGTYLSLAPSLRTYFDQTGLASAAGISPSPGATTVQARPTPAP